VTDTMPKWTERLAQRLSDIPRARKRMLMVAADVVIIPLALWTAIALKLGEVSHNLGENGWLYLAAILASVPVFARMGLYRAVVRFMGPKALVAVFSGVTVSVALIAVLNLTVVQRQLPPTAFGIYWALALVYVGGSRFLGRSLLHYRRAGTQRVAIYGAGSAGAQLASGLGASGQYQPVAFLDDNPSLQRSLVNGIEVFPPEALAELIRDEGVSTVLLALPSQSRRRRQEILKKLEPIGVHVQTVPDFSDIVSGTAAVQDVRDVDANDLLGRDAVPPNERLLGACILGKTVMVTGAGGSIGSELCRQILRLGPSRLLLFEVSELALYNIDRELRLLAERLKSDAEIVSLLGNAHHKYRVREVIQSYAVQTIYHAAAYKHVPIVEHNIIEGIHNNVYSTWYAAEAALECHVETFVLISTDKAVNPTNVMGATKRFAEIVLQGLHERGSATRFCMVRFGNVLESSGSVVPLFREQIKRGGPVTVTHKDVIRYFMTIPEAAQLVLQAGSMARGGDVFVLDMGKPVRIEDLARRMIGLMGLTVLDDAHPDGDIEIVYTGLRPAEKLYEELLIGNNVAGTEHPMIMRAMEHSLPWVTVQQTLEQMLIALNKFDCPRARELLMQSVIEYRPVGEIQDLVWAKKAGAVQVEASNVTTLQKRRGRPGAPGWTGPSTTH
jgi:FlaA1/EpsC-like NDP-sugar epimerase